MKCIEDIVDHMVGEEVFTREDRMPVVIDGVIRLRGGYTLRSNNTYGERPADPISTFEKLVSRTFLRASVVNDEPSPSSLSAGAEVQKTFSVRPLMYTAYTYHMNPLMWSIADYTDICRVGQGPGLYWTTDEFLTSGTTPNPNLGKLRSYTTPVDLVAGKPSCNSQNGIIYVFTADWFGAEMTPYTKFQIDNGDTNARLAWAAAQTTITTDPNIPITYANIASNKDWARIRHYATMVTFDINNLAPFPYVIEIMFFKFQVDPNDLTYTDMQLAPMCNQYDQIHAYCAGSIQQFGTPQITVLKRKRIVIRGLDQTAILANATDDMNTYQIANIVKSNSAKFKFKISRTYDIVRGIKQTAQSLSETALFNNFYEANEGVYCRVQAWPLNCFYTSQPSSATANACWPIINNIHDQACVGASTKNLAVLKPCLQVFLEKRSYIKLDSPMLKGPFQNS